MGVATIGGMNAPNGQMLLRIKEVAPILRISEKTVRRLIDEGKLRSVKIRGLRLVLASSIASLIEGLVA